MDSDLVKLMEAIRAYEQADMEGVMVRVSREACDKAADTIERLSAEKAELKNKVDFLEGVMACDQIVSNELAARIAALEAENKALLSGQPTEVNGKKWQLVPVEPNFAEIKAMAESVAVDDEGPFSPLCDLLGYSGENKTHTVLKAARAAMLTASAQEMLTEQERKV